MEPARAAAPCGPSRNWCRGGAGPCGALLMAAYAPEGARFSTVCKCGSGFSDKDLAGLPRRLKPYMRKGPDPRVSSRLKPDVWCSPGLALEIVGAEITLSPVHTAGWDRFRKGSGLAIRFPRFTGRYRDDKGPEDATPVAEIAAMYRRRLRRAGGRGGARACPGGCAAGGGPLGRGGGGFSGAGGGGGGAAPPPRRAAARARAGIYTGVGVPGHGRGRPRPAGSDAHAAAACRRLGAICRRGGTPLPRPRGRGGGGGGAPPGPPFRAT